MRRWPGRIIASEETPVGVEPTWTGLQPVAVPSGSSVKSSVSSPGIEPGLRPSHGRVLIRHTPRTFLTLAPYRGIEPRLADS